MRSTCAKVAISLDSTLLKDVERLRAHTGESRSALMARALQLLTQAEAQKAKVARYIEVHREYPEHQAVIAAARKRARASLAQLPWDDT